MLKELVIYIKKKKKPYDLYVSNVIEQMELQSLEPACIQLVMQKICCYTLIVNLMLFPSRMLAKDELITLLQRCAEILQLVKSKKMKNAVVQLKDLLTKFKQLDSK